MKPDVVPPLAWFYIVSGAAALGISALVFLARPDRLQNRLLALALFLTVFAEVSAATIHIAEEPLRLGAIHAAEGALWLAVSGLTLAYLAFLGTVDTRWSRPLDSRRVRFGLAAVVAGMWVLRLVDPSLTTRYVQGGAVRSGALDPWFFILIGGVNLFGLLVAVSYWRSTEPGTLRRRQAKAYATAFGARDLTIVLFSVLTAARASGVLQMDLLGDQLRFWLPPLGNLLFAPLAAYGILTTQLFEIDLKLKWTLEKGTVAAVFVAVFFVVSEGAQVLFAGFAGSEILGVLAAGALVFLLSPLQRLAARLGDAAMPGVEDTEAYREERKREVYRASVEELLADGQITAKERRMLGRLQDELGLEGGEASRIEADVVEAAGGEAA